MSTIQCPDVCEAFNLSATPLLMLCFNLMLCAYHFFALCYENDKLIAIFPKMPKNGKYVFSRTAIQCTPRVTVGGFAYEP